MNTLYCDRCRHPFPYKSVPADVQASLYDLTAQADIEVLCAVCLSGLVVVIRRYLMSGSQA